MIEMIIIIHNNANKGIFRIGFLSEEVYTIAIMTLL